MVGTFHWSGTHLHLLWSYSLSHASCCHDKLQISRFRCLTVGVCWRWRFSEHVCCIEEHCRANQWGETTTWSSRQVRWLIISAKDCRNWAQPIMTKSRVFVVWYQDNGHYLSRPRDVSTGGANFCFVCLISRPLIWFHGGLSIEIVWVKTKKNRHRQKSNCGLELKQLAPTRELTSKRLNRRLATDFSTRPPRSQASIETPNVHIWYCEVMSFSVGVYRKQRVFLMTDELFKVCYRLLNSQLLDRKNLTIPNLPEHFTVRLGSEHSAHRN